METIFLVLSGVVLAAGVLYWFWSHIQLTQKKVQLLENAIFELRTLVAAPAADSSGHASLQGHQGPSSGSPSGPVYKDLEDDEAEDGWVPSPSPAGPAVEAGSTSLESLNANSDLQPGGRIDLPPSDEERDIITTDEQFRELFVQRDASSPTVTTTTTSASASSSSSSSSSSESLESMPVKELRRLAEQRGITGSSELRKKELLAALRQQVAPQAAAAATAATEQVEEETTRTLDLTNDVTVLE
jgi:hypothetical protein